MKLARRSFIGGVAAAITATQLPGMLALPGRDHPLTRAVRAVHQQQQFMDSSGSADHYTAPLSYHSTRVYRESLSQEEFLRRHWFS